MPRRRSLAALAVVPVLAFAAGCGASSQDAAPLPTHAATASKAPAPAAAAAKPASLTKEQLQSALMTAEDLRPWGYRPDPSSSDGANDSTSGVRYQASTPACQAQWNQMAVDTDVTTVSAYFTGGGTSSIEQEIDVDSQDPATFRARFEQIRSVMAACPKVKLAFGDGTGVNLTYSAMPGLPAIGDNSIGFQAKGVVNGKPLVEQVAIVTKGQVVEWVTLTGPKASDLTLLKNVASVGLQRLPAAVPATGPAA